ncbi:hypothetical protein SAMN02745866_01198 [Alteromonadaceae bacterium Bs31]|nr:hypothetical protein SAMN02745866_01198 [Alteromonadaceae bacterium Bs31]
MMHMTGYTLLFRMVMKGSHITNACSRGQTLHTFGVTRLNHGGAKSQLSTANND